MLLIYLPFGVRQVCKEVLGCLQMLLACECMVLPA